MAAEPPDDLDAEVQRLLALVQARYGHRLTPAQLDGVRQGLDGVVKAARALRAVKARNSDEPFQPFMPYRSDQ
jgi:hypothetical protein